MDIQALEVHKLIAERTSFMKMTGEIRHTDYITGPRFHFSTTWTFLTRLMAVASSGRIDIQSMARTQPVGFV